MIYEANVSILPSKNDEKPGTKFWKSTGNFAKRFQFKNILTMKKWAVPVYIRGFDSFEPPMSRFCLWETVSFTRFWSRFRDLRGFDLSHIPPKGIYEANVTPAAYLRGFDLVHCAIFGMIVLNFCLSVNSVKYYYFSLLFVNFNPSYAEQPRFSCLFSGKNQRFS